MIRDILIVCGLVIVIVSSVMIVDAYKNVGQGTGEQDQGGTGQQEFVYATDTFGLEPGLAIVKMTHQGEGEFIVNLLSAAGQEETTGGPLEFSGGKNGGSDTEVATALAADMGPVASSRAVKIPVGGRHLFDVKADEPWKIEIEQPHPSSAPEMTSFSGDKDTATPFFHLSSGVKRITITNPLKENLTVNLLDENGNAVASDLGSRATPEADPNPQGTTSLSLDVSKDGIYLFDIQADGLWTIDISDAE